MMMMMKVIAIVCFVILVSAQGPPPQHAECDTPNNWSASISQIILFNNLGAQEANFGEIYVSYPLQVIRFDVAAGETNLGGEPISYSMSVWQDYKNSVEYILDRTTGICSSIPLNYALGTGQLPENTNFGGVILIGSQAVHEYYFPVNGNSGSEFYQVEVGLMSGTCLPYNTEIYNSTSSGQITSMMMSEAFFNVIPTVPPFLLEIPSECTSSSVRGYITDEMERISSSLRQRALSY